MHLATTVPSTGLIAGFNVWPGYLAIGGAGLVGVVGLALLSVALEFFDRPTGF